MTDLLSRLASIAGSPAAMMLLDTTIKATILLIAAFGVSALLQRASAAVRHRVWCLTFVGLLLLPVLSSLLPGWRLAVLPQVLQAEATPTAITAAENSSTFMEADYPAMEDPSVRMQDRILNQAADEIDTAFLEAETQANPGRSEEIVSPPVTHAESNPTGETTSAISWPVLPGLVWLLGAGVAMLPVALSPPRTRRLARSAREINDPEPSGLLRELCENLGIRRTVRLLETDRSLIPMTWGVLRPILLLPGTWRNWTEERCRFVLLHELAHVKRCDVAFQMLARVACALYWFHPLAWLALRRLRVERELACDDCVLMAGQRASDYAQQLLDIARTHHSPAMPTAVAMACSKRLESRVRAVLDRARSHMPLGRGTARIFLVSASIVVTLLAVIQPAARSASQAETADAAAEATADTKDADETATESARKDLYGDPLPQGVVARLGSTRLRHEGNSKRIWIMPDNKTLVSAALHHHVEGNNVRIWDAQTGKLKREINFAPRMLKLCGLAHDGKTLVTLTRKLYIEGRKADNELTAWDTSTWNARSVARWTNTWITAGNRMAVSPDGKTIATVNYHGKVCLRNVATGKEFLSSSLSKNPETSSLAFFSSDKRLVAVTRHGVFLWDWQSSKKLEKFPVKSELARNVSFSSDGKLMVINSSGKPAQLWDVESRQKLLPLESGKLDYKRRILAFSPDRKLLAVLVNRSGNIKPPYGNKIDLFDVETGKLAHSLDMGKWAPSNVAFSPDGQLLASIGGEEQTIKLWKLPEGKSLSDRFIGHDRVCFEMQFTPDGKNIVTGSMDGTVRVWDAGTGRQVHNLQHKRWINGLAVSPDSCQLLSSGFDNTLRLWDLASEKQLHKLKGHGISGSNNNHSVGFTPDGKRLVSFGNDLNLRTFDVGDGRMLAEHPIRPSGLKIEETGNPRTPLRIVGSTDPFSDDVWTAIKHARLTADRSRLLLSAGCMIYEFDTASGRELDKFKLEDSLKDFIVTPDQKLLVTTEQRRYRFKQYPQNFYRYKAFLRIRDFATKKTIRQIELPSWYGSMVAVSADSAHVAVNIRMPGMMYTRRRWISVWNLHTGQEVRRIEGITSRATKLAFSPDGRRLACSLNEATTLVWDLDKFPVPSPLDIKIKQAEATGSDNVQARIDAALEKAREAEIRVLVIYGTDEQKASRDLLKLSENNRALRRFADNEFETVLVDVDPSKPETTSMPTFGADFKKTGLPYLVVLAADGKVLTKQLAIDPASGKSWDTEKWMAFLKKGAVPKLDAKKLFNDACDRAKKEDKAVLIHLGASWCGSCLRLDDFLQQRKQIFEQDYVLLKINIERMVHGKEVVSQVGGNPQVVPWMVIVNAEGKPLITSDGPDGNIGHPGTPKEIEYFLTMIRKASNRMTPEQLEQIKKDLSKKSKEGSG